MSEPYTETESVFYRAPANDDRFCNCCGLPVANEVVGDLMDGDEAIHEACVEDTENE